MRASDGIRAFAVVASAWLLAGCICRGPGAGTQCPADDGGANGPSAAAQAVFTRACVSCHPGEGQEPDLSSAATLANLANARSPMCPGADPFVTPGDPDHSYLVQKLSPPPASAPPHYCGLQMPFGGAPLDAADIATIRAWITSLGADAGAADAATADAAAGDP